MNNIELIIFDLDGTLVDSKYDIGDALNFALDKLNRPPVSYEQVPAMMGGGIQKLLELSLNTKKTPVIEAARVYFDHYYDKHYTHKTACYPGVAAILKYFGARKKAVYSNKIHPFTVGIIRNLGLESQFDLVLGADPARYKKKPSPEGIQFILKSLNVGPERTLMIGDSDHDVHAARAAGIWSCSVSYGYRPVEMLKAAGTHYTIDCLEDLRNLL